MTEVLIVAAMLLLSVAAGLWLYSQFSTAGDTMIAVTGLIRNGMTFLVGVFLLMTGAWPFIILGGVFIALALFLGATHAESLDDNTSLRKRIAG